MLWFVYNVLFAAGYTVLLPRFLFRMLRRGGYRRHFLQRLAVYAPATVRRIRERPRIWVHAVSVGELYVALRFMEEIRRRAGGGAAFVVTTTTSTARRIAEQKLDPADVLLYFPADFPFVVKRALDVIRPRAILLTECELWPNLIRSARRRRIPTALVNGRVSDSSFRGYRLAGVFARKALACMDRFLVQSPSDARRLIELGADPGRVHVTGSAKYDLVEARAPEAGRAGEILRAAGVPPGSRIVLGGSTWRGEEKALLEIYRRLSRGRPDLGLVLVPRHAERRNEVEAEVVRQGFACVKRSELGTTSGPRAGGVLLVDTTGELLDFYAHATVIFVGKSLTARGGQNIIEPAALGKPIVIGPHMENFETVAADFLAEQALLQVSDVAGLEQALGSFLDDASLRDQYGRRAAALVEARRGSVQKSVSLVWDLLREPSAA